MPRRSAPLAVALLTTVLLTACSGGKDPEPSSSGSTPTASPTPTSASASASASPTAATARLVADPADSRISCVQRVERGDRISIYDPTLVAEGDLTLTGIDAVPNDGSIDVFGAEVVTTTSEPSFGPGAGVGDDWPVGRNTELARKTDWPARGPLLGREVADGERILPLVGIEVGEPGGRLEAVRITYRSADGTSSSVEAPIGMRLSRGRC